MKSFINCLVKIRKTIVRILSEQSEPRNGRGSHVSWDSGNEGFIFSLSRIGARLESLPLCGGISSLNNRNNRIWSEKIGEFVVLAIEVGG